MPQPKGLLFVDEGQKLNMKNLVQKIGILLAFSSAFTMLNAQQIRLPNGAYVDRDFSRPLLVPEAKRSEEFIPPSPHKNEAGRADKASESVSDPVPSNATIPDVELLPSPNAVKLNQDPAAVASPEAPVVPTAPIGQADGASDTSDLFSDTSTVASESIPMVSSEDVIETVVLSPPKWNDGGTVSSSSGTKAIPQPPRSRLSSSKKPPLIRVAPKAPALKSQALNSPSSVPSSEAYPDPDSYIPRPSEPLIGDVPIIKSRPLIVPSAASPAPPASPAPSAPVTPRFVPSAPSAENPRVTNPAVPPRSDSRPSATITRPSVTAPAPSADEGSVTLLGNGLLKMKAGEADSAISIFRQILQVEPSNDRARIELAAALYKKGDYDEATQQFNKVMANRPPRGVQLNIQNYLDKMESQGKRTVLSASFYAGGFHDDNINIGPSSDRIDISPLSIGDAIIDSVELGEDALPGETFGVSLGLQAGITHDFGERQNWLGFVSANYLQNLHDDFEGFETSMTGASVGLRRSQKNSLLNLPAHYRHLRLDDEQLLDMAGINPGYIWKMGDDFLLSSFLIAEARSYDNFPERDSGYYELSQVLQRIIKGGHSVSLGLAGFQENADTEMFSNSGWRVMFNANIRLLEAGKTSLVGSASYGEKEFDQPEPLSPAKREDEQVKLGLGIQSYLLKNTRFDVGYSHINNGSTFGLYDFEKNKVSVGVTQSF